MKKILLAMLVVMMSSVLFAGQIVPKISFDNHASGGFNAEGDKDTYKTEIAMGIGAEYLQSLNDNLSVGGGVFYQMDRKLKDSDDDNNKFSFMPIYVTGEYLIKTENDKMIPFAKLNLGYASYTNNYNDDDISSKTGGLYYGLGGGVKVNEKIKVDLMYNVYAGSYKLGNDLDSSKIDVDQKYSTISLSVGYIFDIA